MSHACSASPFVRCQDFTRLSGTNFFVQETSWSQPECFVSVEMWVIPVTAWERSCGTLISVLVYKSIKWILHGLFKVDEELLD